MSEERSRTGAPNPVGTPIGTPVGNPLENPVGNPSGNPAGNPAGVASGTPPAAPPVIPNVIPPVIPSVRGSVFLIGIEGVKGLIADGRLSREEVEFELHAEDIAYLEEKILPGSWYPVGCFDRFASIAVDALGDGEPSYLAERAHAAAPGILASEAYQGLIAATPPGRGGARTAASMLTTVQLMLNFSRWQLDSESGGGQRFEIRVTDAGDLPESLRYTAQGFVQHLASVLTGRSSSVSSERLDQETIIFRGQKQAS